MSQLDQLDQLDQLSQFDQLGQLNQLGQLRQLSQFDHLDQLGQLNQLNQLDDLGHYYKCLKDPTCQSDPTDPRQQHYLLPKATALLSYIVHVHVHHPLCKH